MWSVERIAAYLDERGIRITVKDGRPSFVKPPTLTREAFEFHTATAVMELKGRRRELLELYQGRYAQPTDDPPARDPDRIYRDTPPADARAILLKRVRSFVGFGRVAWHSLYNAQTGWADAAGSVPPHATHVYLEHAPHVVYYLPWSSPPKGWKGPVGFVPPKGWNKPTGWVPKKSPTQRYNPWKEATTYRDSLPPD